MLHKSITVKESSLHGIGLFAKEAIPKGTIIWKLDDGTKIFTDDDLLKQTPTIKEFVKKYGWKRKGKNYLPMDVAKYLNHSKTPNIENRTTYEITIKHIQKGEELLIDYDELNEGKSKHEF